MNTQEYSRYDSDGDDETFNPSPNTHQMGEASQSDNRSILGIVEEEISARNKRSSQTTRV